MTDILKFDGVYASYRGSAVLQDISFSIPEGDCCVSVIGPNGAGKSTLLKVALGLVKPDSGRVFLFGRPPGSSERRKTPIGYVPQMGNIDLAFPVTVREVVAMGRVGYLGPFRRQSKEDRLAVDKALDLVGATHLAKRQIGELSGGERQRVFIARALAQESRLILLDEPASGLDLPTKQSIYELLEEMHGRGITTITATHDLSSIEMHDFEIVICLNRRLIAFGRREDVLVESVLREAFSGIYLHKEGGEDHVHL